jgi:hypothetical protein
MNNNLYNNNNFIGITHLDNGKITLNFILQTSNILEQHILNTSNTLEGHLLNTSNVLEGHILDAKNFNINYTNALRTDVNKWINEQQDEIIPALSTTNTYILNSNIGGYIYFWTKDSEKVYTRINQNGKLQIYHDFDIARPLIVTKWYEVEDILMDYLFNINIINAGAVATAVKFETIDAQLQTHTAQILTIFDAIVLINIEVTKHEELIDYLFTELDFSRYQYFNGLPDTTTIANAIAQNIQKVSKVNSYIQNLFTTGVLVGAIGSAIGLIINNEKEASRLHQLYNYINDPKSPASNLSSAQKNNLINDVNISFSNNVYSYSSNLSNLALAQGFINTNVTTTQIIPKIQTNEITYNGVAIPSVVKTIIINDTPQVNKKSAFYCLTNNIIYPNNGNTAYYAYHIDLRNYTKTGYIDIGSGSGDTYRIFSIKAFFGSMYFQKLVNGIPDIIQYTIYMSEKANSAPHGGLAGVNIQAVGIPQSPFLDTIAPNNIFLLRNSSDNFNYISIVTTQQADIRVFIECHLS